MPKSTNANRLFMYFSTLLPWDMTRASNFRPPLISIDGGTTRWVERPSSSGAGRSAVFSSGGAMQVRGDSDLDTEESRGNEI
ncbi:hypothetical protein M441DRAFT_425818 [Trichoderma asperellum CBS 433.97]|uniref:Uncharacterized protein n=1 Tax=Trichoderma asperellum (strain ATCC 204424 / CBS 433.97 / NBRC 101777) TaxID=1042311 RepID=A0A2T3Z5I7_TRIA4|nr:hypothetical protein M441DRAFT_425818 [Trichoderma asperellum CBS 433.97]PTB40054.1 hypothetical protein M441DRAFT_425818 [Trichoderma asperellum CBS 433.97]